MKNFHLQIDVPNKEGKTRAHGIKEALMMMFATSKFIKLHPINETEVVVLGMRKGGSVSDRK